MGDAPGARTGRPAVPVRLVTFNTHHGVGDDGRHDLARLATVLAAADADVVCLQEVDRYYGGRSEDVDQALLLARGLGMQLAWGPAIDRPRPDAQRPRQYGNALLSRLPVLASDVHPLPGGGEPRSALRAAIGLDGAVLEVTTTHLSARSAEERAAQLAAIAALPAGPARTGVLVGDLNADPGAPELAALAGRFTDAWELAPDRADRAGRRFWQAGRGQTHPARRPHRRIDQVWVSPGVDVARAHVLDGAGASDHLPLVVDLRVRSSG